MKGEDALTVRDAANYAIKNGYKRKDGGTTPDYFTSILANNGIDAGIENNIDNIQSKIGSGTPVVLLGQSRYESPNSPFGTTPH